MKPFSGKSLTYKIGAIMIDHLTESYLVTAIQTLSFNTFIIVLPSTNE